MTAIALLVLAAGLALGGSFGVLTVFESAYTSPGSATPEFHTTLTYTAWHVVQEPPSPEPATYEPLDGYPVVVAAVAVMAALLVLVTAARTPTGQVLGRVATIGAAALLVGVLAELWVGLLANYLQTVRRIAAADARRGEQYSFGFGVGAWLELAAFGCAAAACVLLLLSILAEGRAYRAGIAAGSLHPAGEGDRP